MPVAGSSAIPLTRKQQERLHAIIRSEYVAFGWHLPPEQVNVLASNIARTCTGLNGKYSEDGARRVARTWAWLRADVFPVEPLINYARTVIERQRKLWNLTTLPESDVRRMALDSLYFTYMRNGSYPLSEVWENARAFARGSGSS